MCVCVCVCVCFVRLTQHHTNTAHHARLTFALFDNGREGLDGGHSDRDGWVLMCKASMSKGDGDGGVLGAERACERHRGVKIEMVGSWCAEKAQRCKVIQFAVVVMGSRCAERA